MDNVVPDGIITQEIQEKLTGGIVDDHNSNDGSAPKYEILPALTVSEELNIERVGDGAEPVTSDSIPMPEKDYAKTSENAQANSRGKHLLPLLKLTISTVLVGVFAVAAYTDIAHAASSFTAKDAARIAADAAFGVDFSGKSEDTPSAPSETSPPKHSLKSKFHELYFEGDMQFENTDYGDGNMDEGVIDGSSQDNGDTVTRYPIVARDLSATADRGLECSNQTDYELDLDYFADAPLKIPPLSQLLAENGSDASPSTSNIPASSSPVVLIIHTHGTESYAPEGADTYASNDNARTDDITQNVVAVGEVMAEYFESRGIPTVHCTEMFDRNSYINAYKNSSAAVREYLAIYPSIRYIFDVHRDSVISSDYTKYRPVTDIDGTPTAQFMCVVGTNFKGADHPHWRDNLTLAAHLQNRMWDRSTSLPRRLSIRGASFYQQYASGSLLLEIGSCGNTLSEAKACARIVAEEISELIIQ